LVSEVIPPLAKGSVRERDVELIDIENEIDEKYGMKKSHSGTKGNGNWRFISIHGASRLRKKLSFRKKDLA